MIIKPEELKIVYEKEDDGRIRPVYFIDAVKVVRCKDCKHLFDGEHNANCCDVLMKKAKWITEITVDDNWYCHEGERRTDELGITN